MSRHMAGHPQFVVRHKPGALSAALPQIFERPLRDPEFLAEADRLALEIDLVTGDTLQTLVERMFGSPARGG